MDKNFFLEKNDKNDKNSWQSTAALHHYNITSVQDYITKALQHYVTTVLQHYVTIALYSTTALQNYRITQQRYKDIKSQEINFWIIRVNEVALEEMKQGKIKQIFKVG